VALKQRSAYVLEDAVREVRRDLVDLYQVDVEELRLLLIELPRLLLSDEAVLPAVASLLVCFESLVEFGLFELYLALALTDDIGAELL
jgi:hypothetical protein